MPLVCLEPKGEQQQGWMMQSMVLRTLLAHWRLPLSMPLVSTTLDRQ